jgi:hypothetical protein
MWLGERTFTSRIPRRQRLDRPTWETLKEVGGGQVSQSIVELPTAGSATKLLSRFTDGVGACARVPSYSDGISGSIKQSVNLSSTGADFTESSLKSAAFVCPQVVTADSVFVIRTRTCRRSGAPAAWNIADAIKNKINRY